MPLAAVNEIKLSLAPQCNNKKKKHKQLSYNDFDGNANS